MNIPQSVLNDEKKIIMGFSPKAACSTAVKMFFDYINLIEEAKAYNPKWIHAYRKNVYHPKNPTTSEKFDSNEFTKFKVVRNPYTRVVSSYKHAVISGYAHKEISEALTLEDSSNITFLQFLDYLGKIDLSKCFGDHSHHGLQVCDHELNGQTYDYICKIESLEDDIKDLNTRSNNQIEVKSSFSNSWHHSSNEVEYDSTVFDKNFKDLVFWKHEDSLIQASSTLAEKHPLKYQQQIIFPNYPHFYNEDVANRVYDLYLADFKMYKYDKNSYPK